MSFLRSPIMAGPVRPTVLTDIFSYQSHCFVFLFLFIYIYIFFFIISNYSTLVL